MELASCTVVDTVRCSIVASDDEIQLNEEGTWSEADLTLRHPGDEWEFTLWRGEEESRFYATDEQMLSLRDWLNKRIKD